MDLGKKIISILLYFFINYNLASCNTKIYDLVILHTRVINPETKFDKLDMNIGIENGKIKTITKRLIKGKKEIDAKGLITAPGFIDLLSYDPVPTGIWNKIADGVTSNIAMHGGTAFPEKWYSYYKKMKLPFNYGASFFYMQARNSLGINRYKSANSEQIKKLITIAEEALKKGVLGVSFSLEYQPGTTRDEIVPMMFLAKKYNVPVFFHTRYSDIDPPGTSIEGLREVIDYAKITGAGIHIDHINSTGGTFCMKEALDIINKQINNGLDITACIYPYNYWATYLNSARFDKGWQKRFQITYKDLQIGGTSERLTASTFNKYRKEGKLAVAYAIPEEDVTLAIKNPIVMIGSDAILTRGYNNHPRASGTFCRTIRIYVKEKKIITLMDAIEKMTLLPAKRLEKSSSIMKFKGRITEEADADIVIFNYDKISDKATVEHPENASVGIEYVIVNGKIVKDPKGFNKNISAGKAIIRNL